MTVTQSDGAMSEKLGPPTNETTKLLDAWLEPKGPVALHLHQKLLPVETDESGRGVIFPPTYADIGYNIDTLADGTRVATIDSVGSQANRLEPVFKKSRNEEPPSALSMLVPQIEIVLHGKAGKKGKATEDAEKEASEYKEKRSILDLAHRSADAVVLASPTLAEHVAKAFDALRRTGNAAPLAVLAPTSLVFGVWDSRGGSGEKRPRLVRAIIRAWDVEVLHSAAQFNSVWKALSESQQEELESEAKAKKVKLSVKGFADAPATFRKTKNPDYLNGSPNPEARVLGGVLAKGSIARDVTINLIALRGLRGKNAHETKQLHQYMLGLSLLAASADLELFLREGCLLRYADEKDAWMQVPRRSVPMPTSLPSHDEILKYTSIAATHFKAQWPNNLTLEHDFNLAEAKRLLAKKDEEGPAGEPA
jgi:CRISPR-associated protein Csb1